MQSQSGARTVAAIASSITPRVGRHDQLPTLRRRRRHRSAHLYGHWAISAWRVDTLPDLYPAIMRQLREQHRYAGDRARQSGAVMRQHDSLHDAAHIMPGSKDSWRHTPTCAQGNLRKVRDWGALFNAAYADRGGLRAAASALAQLGGRRGDSRVRLRCQNRRGS